MVSSIINLHQLALVHTSLRCFIKGLDDLIICFQNPESRVRERERERERETDANLELKTRKVLL